MSDTKSETQTETSSNIEDLTDKFEIILNNEKENVYKCLNCDFITKFKHSIKRHLNKENPCFLLKKILKCIHCNKIFSKKDDYNKHINKKKPCSIETNKTIIVENYEEDKKIKLEEDNKNIKIENKKLHEEMINLKEELELLKKENQLLKDRNNNLEKKYKDNEKNYTENYNSLFEYLSNMIIEINNQKKLLKKKVYENKLEYYILHRSITKNRNGEINEENKKEIKEKLNYLLEILNDEYFDKFFNDVKTKYNEIIPLIHEYIIQLNEREGDKKKINGLSLKKYAEKISLILAENQGSPHLSL
jgi:uncharacterized C2H2 Zn-finger protein